MKIDVQLPGADTTTQMEESDLLKLEGHFDTGILIGRWVQYHLPSTGEMVHRSLHLIAKQSTADGGAGNVG